LKKRGVIRRIAVDPAPRADGVPRLALDVDLGTPAAGTRAAPDFDDRPPPSGLPRPYKHPLPSVLLSSAFAHQIASDVPSAAPPRARRPPGAAAPPRRFPAGGARAIARAADEVRAASDEFTQPIAAGVGRVAAISPAWLAVPIMLAAATLAFVVRFPQ